MHQIRFRLGLRSRPHRATGGAYSAPQTPTWILGVLRLREARGGEEAKRERKKKNKKGKGRKGRQVPPPSPIRYATGSREPFASSGTLGDLTWLEDFLTSKWPGSFTALAPPLCKNWIPEKQGPQINRQTKVKGDMMQDVPWFPKQLRTCRCSSSTMP